MKNEIVSRYKNYLIIENPNVTDKRCLLIFSSNGLHDSATSDKYEFSNICECRRIRKAFRRIIFVKDSQYCFYINGINDEINNIKKLIDLLKSLTEGYSVCTGGYSSGGYMATLCAIYMDNVERVLSFGGILNVLDWHGSFCDYNFSDNKNVKNATPVQQKYFNLTSKIESINACAYFVYAGFAKSDQPMAQYLTKLDKKNIKVLIFNTKQHGYYNLPSDYKYLFTFKSSIIDKKFLKYKGKIARRKLFSLALQGPVRYLINFFQHQIFRLKRIFYRQNR